MDDLHGLGALGLWQALHRREVTVVEVVEHYLTRIERSDRTLGAFVTVTADRALDRARALDAEERRSAVLWGLPSADKDLWARRGVVTTYGSALFRDTVPDNDDPLVAQLDAAGSVSLGKTHTPEFGMPAYTESRVAPPARTPWDLTRGAGGSSGGAAAAVAAGLLPFAPGSDGGGSIRIPAACCGLVGLKPSRGLVPDGSGQLSLAGLPVAGPLARSTADAALLLDGMIRRRTDGSVDAGFTLRAPLPNGPFLAAAVRGEGRFQLGVSTTSPWESEYAVRPVAEATEALGVAVQTLTDLGHGLEETGVPEAPGYPGAFRTVWMSGAAAIPVPDDRIDELEPLTAWLVRGGRDLPARALVDALAELARFERSLVAAWSGFDAVLTPALAQPSPRVGSWATDEGERNFAQQVEFTPYSSMVNVAGLPAIVVPVLRTAEGPPWAVQLVGRPGGEATLLALAAQLERRIRWTAWRPPGW